MSLTRATLIVIQALGNHFACTPPNPTPQKGRYHTNEWWVLRIAPFIFKCHQMLVWGCAFFEVLHYISFTLPLGTVPSQISSLVCLPSSSSSPSPTNPYLPLRPTPFFIIGALAVILGAYIRLDCFHTLGKLFTFDLTIHPEHRLITNRFYAYVRHPAYTGSLLLVFGLAFSHLTKGSWLTECGPLVGKGRAEVVWAFWWIWTLSVGISRADAEDKQMRKLFKEEWETYAANVPWWFLPGLI